MNDAIRTSTTERRHPWRSRDRTIGDGMYHAGRSASEGSGAISQRQTASSSTSHSESAASANAVSSSSEITSSATRRAYAARVLLRAQVEDVRGVVGRQAHVRRRALPDVGLIAQLVDRLVGRFCRQAQALEIDPEGVLLGGKRVEIHDDEDGVAAVVGHLGVGEDLVVAGVLELNVRELAQGGVAPADLVQPLDERRQGVR